MNNGKNLISNNEKVDEELLSQFFAHSMHMQLADNGFSSHVMLRVQEEVPARQRLVYYLWSAALTIASVVAFFVTGGVSIMRSCIYDTLASLASSLADYIPHITPESLELASLHINLSPTTSLQVVLTILVLCSVAWYDIVESR